MISNTIAATPGYGKSPRRRIMIVIRLILCDLIHPWPLSVSRSECWCCCLPHMAGHADRSEPVSHSRLLHRLLSVQLRVFASATRGTASRDNLRSCNEPVPKSAAEILRGTRYAVVQQCLCVSPCLLIMISRMACNITSLFQR